MILLKIKNLLRAINRLPKQINLILKQNKIIIGALSDNYYGKMLCSLYHANVPEKYYNIFYYLSPQDVCIDCGVNRGRFTDILILRNCIVYGFEPHKLLYQNLLLKYKNNKNITIFNQAVHTKNEIIPFYLNTKEIQNINCTESASLIKRTDIETFSCEVEGIDFVEFTKTIIKQHRKIKLIKLDIEGAEFDIIEKIIENKIYEYVEYILCETHERLIENGTERLKTIKKLIEINNIKNIFLDWI